MGVPIVTTFIPLVAISLVLGVVSIVTFTEMHEDQMNQSMINLVSGFLLPKPATNYSASFYFSQRN